MPKAAKGSAFEREFSRELSLWWSSGQRDDMFWRTAGSGGRATNRAKQGKSTANSAGDIGATDAEGQKLLSFVTFELKRGYSGLSIQDILDHGNPNNQFQGFIDQAKASASLAGTPHWALVLKRDRRNRLILTSYNPQALGVDIARPGIELFTADGAYFMQRLETFLSPESLGWHKSRTKFRTEYSGS